jgi:hypothetical protein
MENEPKTALETAVELVNEAMETEEFVGKQLNLKFAQVHALIAIAEALQVDEDKQYPRGQIW